MWVCAWHGIPQCLDNVAKGRQRLVDALGLCVDNANPEVRPRQIFSDPFLIFVGCVVGIGVQLGLVSTDDMCGWLKDRNVMSGRPKNRGYPSGH